MFPKYTCILDTVIYKGRLEQIRKSTQIYDSCLVRNKAPSVSHSHFTAVQLNIGLSQCAPFWPVVSLSHPFVARHPVTDRHSIWLEGVRHYVCITIISTQEPVSPIGYRFFDIWSAHCHFSLLMLPAMSTTLVLNRISSFRIIFFREIPSVFVYFIPRYTNGKIYTTISQHSYIGININMLANFRHMVYTTLSKNYISKSLSNSSILIIQIERHKNLITSNWATPKRI